jgi:GNAT superfamily N-acetyltransferase
VRGVDGAADAPGAITIRPLGRGDAAACDAIVASLPYHFGDPHGREMCAAAVREQAGLVAARNDDPVAFITWRHWYAAAVEITWMAVRADERRRGIGRALVEELVAQLDPAIRYAVVTTLSEAAPEPGIEDTYAGTRAFWRRCGFEPVWDPAGWWNDENQAVLMVRSLHG